MNLIPAIGLKGLYTLLEPFNTLLEATSNYTTQSVRTLKELNSSGVDAKSEYYTANNLGDDVYTADYSAGVCIVGLMSDGGKLVHVPSSYIASYPNMSGVTYTGVAILVVLPPIPDTLSLTAVKSKLIQATQDEIGVTATTKTLTYTATKSVTQDDHARLETLRLANIASSDTDNAKILALQKTVSELQSRNAELEAYIVAHN